MSDNETKNSSEQKDNESPLYSIYNEENLKDVIKTEYESSRRSRTFVVALSIASLIALSCLWNSLSFSWKHKRIEGYKNYVEHKLRESKNDGIQRQLLKLHSYPVKTIDSLRIHDSIENSLLNKIRDYKAISYNSYLIDLMDKSFSDVLDTANLKSLYMSYYMMQNEHIKNFKIPLFDIDFDINDIAFIGGLGFAILLLVLFLCLKRDNENIRISFKAASLAFEKYQEKRPKEYYLKKKNFYYILSMNQLLAMPHIMDKPGNKFIRTSPKILMLMPAFFSLCIFVNDLLTANIGIALSIPLTFFEYIISPMFFGVNSFLTFCCIRESLRIDSIWECEKKWINENESILKS
jgi:hypothetical protein